MSGAVKILLACAYCYQPVVWNQGAIELRGKRGQALREGQIATLQCPHCDSKFVVDLNTRRKSKGRRLKAVEAKRKTEHDAKVREAEIENEEIAKQLLMESGCDCGEYAERQRAHGNYGYGDRKDGLRSTGTGQDGVPLPPQHRYGCPANPRNRQEAA